VETSLHAFLISVIDGGTCTASRPTAWSPEQRPRFVLNKSQCRAGCWGEDRNIWPAPKSERISSVLEPTERLTALTELSQIPCRLERPSIWLHAIRKPCVVLIYASNYFHYDVTYPSASSLRGKGFARKIINTSFFRLPLHISFLVSLLISF